MTRNKIVIENYGIIPPENSIPFWEDNNTFDEDKVVFEVDLQTSLQKLTPTEREIIKYYNDGYSIREIEEIINLPRATIQDTKDRAITKLRKMMNGEDSIYSVFA